MDNYTPTSDPAGDVLVQSRISDRASNFRVSVFADLVKVERVADLDSASKAQIRGGKRGHIQTFSPASRKRMLEQLAKLRDTRGGHFITLTYAGRFMWSADEVKNHVAVFRKALIRRFPRVGAFWRMELKPRLSGESAGELVPHFHLLVFGVDAPLAYLRAWVSATWSRIAHYPDAAPRKLRTQVDIITTRKHAAAYASKYAAKVCEDSTLVLFQSENSWGRHWGTFGNLDLAAVMVVTLGLGSLIQFKRLVRGWLKSRGSRYAPRLAKIREDFGFSCFGLGDLSSGGGCDMFDGTVARMLFASAV